jgi:mannose-6-phosphate isomerase-like protein (cupin superfamily)
MIRPSAGERLYWATMRTSLFSGTVFVVFALAAAAAGQSAGAGVKIIPNAQMTEAFKKGVPVVETGEYKVLAARRDAPGQVEVHELDTDVIHVLEGSAVLVTGGTVEGGKTTAPNEIRGTSIAGGEAHPVTKGDVIVIPRGVPHWFKEVPQTPFLYFVVKSVARSATK